MVVPDPVEWTASRIKRLLRPLKCKCLALSSYMNGTAATVESSGTRDRMLNHELLPLEAPSNIGIRIHLDRNVIQALQLTKRIHAVRDCYSDITLRKDKSKSCHSHCSDITTVSSLTTLCSVILGTQIPCDTGQPDDSADPGEELYDTIPPAYRFQTLSIHALHVILDICPPHAGLYLALLDVALRQRLYHESSVLIDVVLDHAFELSQENHLPRISHPAHRKFLVNLFCEWSACFPCATFVRLVTGALRRAPSHLVWTTKATKRLARRLGCDDIKLFAQLLGEFVETVLVCQRFDERRSADAGYLQSQLTEWLNSGFEACTISLQESSTTQLTVQNESFVEFILDHCRHWLPDYKTKGFEGSPFIGVVICFYTLWLASGPRALDPHDTLSDAFRRVLPPPSTYTPACRHIFRKRSLVECEEILNIMASVLHRHGFALLEASLWVCALHYVEAQEVEQSLTEEFGGDAIRRLRLRLIDSVDEAERSCFGKVPGPAARHGSRKSRDPEASYDDRGVMDRWDWEPAVGCWFRKTEGIQDSHQNPPKRRRIDRHSRLEGNTSFPDPLQSRHPNGRSGDSLRYRRQGDVDENPRMNGNRGGGLPAFEFASFLSDALSGRTALRVQVARGEQQVHEDEGGEEEQDAVSVVDSGDYTDEGGDDGFSTKNSDSGSHMPSEDFLDLFRTTGASSPEVISYTLPS